MTLTHLSLFTGIGGIDLAAEWAGFETVGQCEWADYPTKVLEKHWPDVVRWRDIRTLTGESFYERTGRKTVDLVSGGFPCQPFSVAGKQRGHEDDRFLWPEMLRVISELKPRWVLGENVAGIINMALDQVLFDLENIGYETQAFIIPACAVDAQHRRDRVFIVAYTEHYGSSRRKGAGCANATDGEKQARQDDAIDIEGAGGIRRLVANTERKRQEQRKHEGQPRCGQGVFEGLCQNVANSERMRKLQSKGRIGDQRGWISNSGQDVPNAPGIGQQGERTSGQQVAAAHGRPVVSLRDCGDRTEWPAEPDVGRVAHGIPNRMDRIKGLGNAVVPQQVYPILKAIAEIEGE